ncbi:MAG: LPS export ABC transporter periplasmic protein LptC [Prevotellaceae bacterium]|jgi:LPS export ABC transporter protein LptC|nr:LPS export ABC transporter periplasmic protein LptC [Prevotellaceae bacterium]
MFRFEKSFVFLFVAVCLFLLSCGDSKPEIVAMEKRDSIPLLLEENVSTLISDSGITRFRITAPQWLIFDKRAEPYWSFPKGIYFERFDENYQVEATMRAREAIYYENRELWEFNGAVEVKNLADEVFTTEQLFWNNGESRFYSDSIIHIQQKERNITGIGFESNASLTRYTIRKPIGEIPVENQQ